MRRVLLVLLAVVLVNLPWVHQAWVDHRIDTEGTLVSARVIGARIVDGDPLVQYRLPVRVDPKQQRYSVRVDEAHYSSARRTHRIPVRVVPGHPAENRPAGEVRGSLVVVVAVIGDVILAALLLALRWRRRRAKRNRLYKRRGLVKRRRSA